MDLTIPTKDQFQINDQKYFKFVDINGTRIQIKIPLNKNLIPELKDLARVMEISELNKMKKDELIEEIDKHLILKSKKGKSSIINPLPSDLNNLITQYVDEKEYQTQIKNTNKIQKNKIIEEELNDINIDDLIKFKLSMQLGKNWLKDVPINGSLEVNPVTIASIFLGCFNLFTYEQMLNYKDKKLIIFLEPEESIPLLGYIDKITSAFVRTSNNDFENDKIMFKSLNKNLANRIRKLNEDGDSYELYLQAKNNLLSKKIGIYEDTKYTDFLNLFEEELDKILKSYGY
jgi:hypothetical protein